MPTFRALINGQNFRMRDVETQAIQTYGFYTTAFVESESLEAAEFAAIDAVREDTKLRELILNHRRDPPRMFVEEIHQVRDSPSDPKRPTYFL